MVMVRIGQTGDWGRAAHILAVAPTRLRIAMDRAVLQEAQFFRKKVVEGFREQAPGGKAFKPLSETTLAIRRFTGFGGTKALIVRGDLRNGVKVVKRRTPLGAEAFVGVLRSARGRDGQSLVNIAEIHEFGAGPFVIEVTPAMRKFLMAAFSQELGGTGGGGSGGISRGFIIVKIPARPFIQPVADKYFNSAAAAARFQRRVATNLGFIMGGPGSGGGGRRGGGGLGAAIRRASGGPARDPITGRFRGRE